jgi:serine protease Do
VQLRLAVLVVVPALLAGAGCKGRQEPQPQGTALPPGAVPVTSAAVVTAGDPAPGATPQAGNGGADASGVQMGPLSFAPIAKRADPSVVTIYTVADEEPQGALLARRRTRAQKGLGTGFIVGKDGVIITNNHVVDGADEITVQLSDERRFPAKIAGRDPRTDIAVIRIDGAKDLASIPLGDSDALEVGDWVVAIGNPFGLSHTVSAGIVSAKGRGREDVPLDPSGYYNFIQTDASINPGNSGGPLLNLKGEVVGMNSAIRGGGAQGIGFAIPINMVKQLMPTLLAKGHLTRSALGVRIRDVRDLPPDERAQLKVDGEKGAVIEFVEPSGPADAAKLQVGDVIVGFEGQPIERGSLLQWLASTAGVGKTVSVRVMRAGKTFDLKVTLGELREPKLRPRPRVRPDEEPDPFDR